MSKSVYLHSGQETTGPFPVNDLETRRVAGELPPDAKIHDGQAWVPAAEFLARGTTPASPAALPPVPGTAAEPGPAGVSTPAVSPAVDPEAMLRAALVLEKEPAPLLSGVRWESLLFCCRSRC
ncbi:MAG: hypothetical protein EXS37_09795 [Opitutus sp.]|nr:hypothetical protein [Opitutus sp.]